MSPLQGKDLKFPYIISVSKTTRLSEGPPFLVLFPSPLLLPWLLPLNHFPLHRSVPIETIMVLTIMLQAHGYGALVLCQAHSCIISFNPPYSFVAKELSYFNLLNL